MTTAAQVSNLSGSDVELDDEEHQPKPKAPVAPQLSSADVEIEHPAQPLTPKAPPPQTAVARANIAQYPENQQAPDPAYLQRKASWEAIQGEPAAPPFEEDPEQERSIRAQQTVQSAQSVIPQAVVPALQAIQSHVNEPLERMSRAGAEFGRDAALQSVTSGAGEGNLPMDQAAREQRAQEFTQTNPRIAGTVRAAGSVIGGMVADPRMWPFFLAGPETAPALRAASGYGFSAQMAQGAYEQAGELGKLMGNPDASQEDKWEAGANFVLSAIMAGHGAGSALAGEFQKLPAQDQTEITARIREKEPDVAAQIDQASKGQQTAAPNLTAADVEIDNGKSSQPERFRLPKDTSAAEVQGPVKGPNIRTVQVGDKTYAFDQRKINADGVTSAVERGELWRLSGGKPPEAAKVQAETDLKGEEPTTQNLTANDVEKEEAAPAQGDVFDQVEPEPEQLEGTGEEEKFLRENEMTFQPGAEDMFEARQQLKQELQRRPTADEVIERGRKVTIQRLREQERRRASGEPEIIAPEEDDFDFRDFDPTKPGPNEPVTIEGVTPKGELSSGSTPLEELDKGDRRAEDRGTPRRTDVAQRKRVADLTPDERAKQLLTSDAVDLPNKRAFEEKEQEGHAPAIAMSDADGLKAFNDKFGYEAGSSLLRAKAESLKEAGLDAYHDKGDEFLHRGESAGDLQAKLEHARESLRNKEFTVTDATGRKLTLKGVDFSYGTGSDLATAESGLKSHKSEREARGERARGELRGITETGSQAADHGRTEEVKEEKPHHDFASTQINISSSSELGSRHTKAVASIPEDRLGENGKETTPHVTVRYGLKDDSPEAINKIKDAASRIAPFEANVGKTTSFPETKEGDRPIIAQVDKSPELNALRSAVEGAGDFKEDTHGEYKPHITLGYVKPEHVAEYEGGNHLEGGKVPVDHVTVSKRDGTEVTIPLGGEENPKVVPGGRSPFTGDETGMNEMQQLTRSIAQNTEGKSLAEKLRKGAGLGEKASGPGAASEALGRIKGRLAALWNAYVSPAPWRDYETATGKWSGAEQASALDLDRFTKAVKDAVPSKKIREAMSNWIEAGGDEKVLRERADKSSDKFKPGYEAAITLTDKQKTIARNVMAMHDATMAEAQKAGLMEQGVENYIQHIYSDKPKYVRKIMAETNFNSLNPKPSFTKQRVLPTYFDAEQLGFTPKDKDVAYLTAVHERSLREALAARAYVHALMEGNAEDGRPLVATSWASAKEIGDGDKDSAYLIKPNMKPGEEYADYRKIDHPALRGWKWSGDADGKPIFVQGDALVHPEAFRRLKNNLTKSALRSYEFDAMGQTFRPGAAALDLQNQIKQFVLSFSAFHQTTLGIHALEHRTRPAFMPDLDLSDEAQRKLVDHGLMVAHYDAEEAFSEGVAGGGLITKVPGIGPAYNTYREYLFKDYLPRIKMQMAKNALERNMEAYKGKLSDDQIYAQTARQANAAFGGLNYRMMGRNKTFQDTLRLALMAPDFTEARGRFVGQALKPYGREQRIAFIGGALALYTVARLLNEELDGKAHWDKPFSVVHKGKEYSLRSVQGDVLNLLENPVKFFANRLSPGVRALTGQDDTYKKKHETVTDKIKSHAAGVAPIPLQPWLQKGHNSNAEKAVESILKMVGVNEKKVSSKH